LTKQGINGGDSIKALVFLTIMMTVFFQGLTAGWVASLLDLRLAGQTDQDCPQGTNRDDVNIQKYVDKNSLTSELVEL
ncbi:MAG: sodium:proton antiporter, partial [Tolypothrix sp. Co-bin9]|nr:sodium:proton antiporter [Tolypothrix sp. Co-bin9]